MPDAMNFKCSVTMATRPNENNNKGRIQPNGKKNSENAIHMKRYSKNDSANKLCEVFHINVTYLKETDTYLRETQHSICDRKTSQRCHISNKHDHQNLFLALPFFNMKAIDYPPPVLHNFNYIQVKE